MPFAFSQIDPSRSGQVTQWDIPINDWFALKFGLGRHDTAGSAISRMIEDWNAGGDDLDAETANREYGIPGHLTFTRPIRAQRAALMKSRKREELDRMAYLEAASHDAISWKGAGGFIAQMAGSLASPVDFGLMFIPIVGSAERAAGLAKVGAPSARVAFARGLIQAESLKYPRLSAAMIEGSVGNAITEIPVFIQNARDQANYGFEDSAFNVIAGGVFGGAIVGLTKLLAASGRGLSGLKRSTKDAALRDQLNATGNDQPGNLKDVVDLDENLIRERVKFDEVRERAKAIEEANEGMAPREATIRALLEFEQARDVDLVISARRIVNDAADKNSPTVRILNKLIERYRGG